MDYNNDEGQVPLTPAERLVSGAYINSRNNVEWSDQLPAWVTQEIERRNRQLENPQSESVFARLQTRQVEDVAGNPVTQLSFWRRDAQTKFPDKAYNLYYNRDFDALGVSDPYSSTVRFFTGQVNAERTNQRDENLEFSRRSRDQVFSDFVRRPSLMFREADPGFASPHFKMNRNEVSGEVLVNLMGAYQLPKEREVFNDRGEVFTKPMRDQEQMAALNFVRGSTGNRNLTPFKSLVVDPETLFGKTALPLGVDRRYSEKAKDHRREFREKNAFGRSPTQVGSLDQPAFRYAGSPTKSGARAAHLWVDDYGFFSEGGAFTLNNEYQVMSPSQFRIQGSAGMSVKDLEAQGFVIGAVYGQQKPEWEMEGGLHYAGDRSEIGGYHVGNNAHAYVGALTRMEGGDWVATMVGVNPFHNAENKPSAFMKDQMQPVEESHPLMQMGKKILGKFPASIQPMPLKDERLPSMALRIFMAHERGATGVYDDLTSLAEEKGMDMDKVKSAIGFVGRGGRKTTRQKSARMLDIKTDDPEMNALLLEAASRYTLKHTHRMPIDAYYSTQLVRQAKKDMTPEDFTKRFGDLSDEDLNNAGANIHLQNYMVNAVAADILINPHKKTATGESNYDPRRLNILARYNPEMAETLMRMDAAGKFPNKYRRIVKADLHDKGMIPDLPTIHSADINWDAEYMGAMFDAPPRATELEIQKQMFARLAERFPEQYLQAGDHTFPMFKDLASGIHGEDYEEAQGTFAGKLASTLISGAPPKEWGEGIDEAKQLLGQFLEGGRVRKKALSINLPALAGAVIGSPYIDQGYAVANQGDISRILKRMGYDKDVRKEMESTFRDTGLLANLHMQTSNERTALPMMQLISKEMANQHFPGVKDLVIPQGKMLMGQLDVGAQDKDYDSDLAEMILGGFINRTIDRNDPLLGRGDENLNFYKKIAQAGQGVEKLRTIAEKGYTKGKNVSGLVKSMEQMFKSGFEMSATHPPFVEFLNSFAQQVGTDLNIGDDNTKALLRATSMVGNQPYQLAMDNEYSLSGATQFFKRAYNEFAIGAPIGQKKTRFSVFRDIKPTDPDSASIPTRGILPGDSAKLALLLLDRAVSMERGAKGSVEENREMYLDRGDRQGYARFLSTALLPVSDAANTDRADRVYKALAGTFDAYSAKTQKSEPSLLMNHTGMIDVLQAITGIDVSDEVKDQFRGYLKEDNLIGSDRRDGSGAATKYMRGDNALMDAALDLMVGTDGAENMNIFGLYAVGVGAANTRQHYHDEPVFTNRNAGAPPLDMLGNVTQNVRNHIQFRKGNLPVDKYANIRPLASLPGDTHAMRMLLSPKETAEYDRGGYTGDGLKYEEKGTVHAGEYVINQEDVARIREGRGEEVINMVERDLMANGDLLRQDLNFDPGGYYNKDRNQWGGGAQNKAERDAQLRELYPRHGTQWQQAEEDTLKSVFNLSHISTPEQLRDFLDSSAEALQRTPGAINSRLYENKLISEELFKAAENVLPFQDTASIADPALKVDNSPTPQARKLAAQHNLHVDQIPLPQGADRLRKEHVQRFVDRRARITSDRFDALRQATAKNGRPYYPSNNDMAPGGAPPIGAGARPGFLAESPEMEATLTYGAGTGRVESVSLRGMVSADQLDNLIRKHVSSLNLGRAKGGLDWLATIQGSDLDAANRVVNWYMDDLTPEERGSMDERELLAVQSLYGTLSEIDNVAKTIGAAGMSGFITSDIQERFGKVGQTLEEAERRGLRGVSQFDSERREYQLDEKDVKAARDAALEQVEDERWLESVRQSNVAGADELSDLLLTQNEKLSTINQRAGRADQESAARLSALDVDARTRQVKSDQEEARDASEAARVRRRTARRTPADAADAEAIRLSSVQRNRRMGWGDAGGAWQPESRGARDAARVAANERFARRQLGNIPQLEADIALVESYVPDEDYSQEQLAAIGAAQKRLTAVDKAVAGAPRVMQGLSDDQLGVIGRVSEAVTAGESVGITGKTAYAASVESAKTARRNAESRNRALSDSGITPFNVVAFEEIGKSIKQFAGTLGELNTVIGHVTKGHEGYIKQAKQLSQMFNQEVDTLARADAALDAVQKSGGTKADLSYEQRRVLDRAERDFGGGKTFRQYLTNAAPTVRDMEREVMKQELQEGAELPYQQIKGKEREELQWELLRNQHRRGGREKIEEAASQGFFGDFMMGLPASQGMRGLSLVGNLARGFGNLVDPNFIWGAQAINRFLIQPSQRAMKAYTDEQMVIGQAMMNTPGIDVSSLSDSAMFTALNRRERQEDAQVALGRQAMGAWGWLNDVFLSEGANSSLGGFIMGAGAPVAGVAGLTSMAAKGFGVNAIGGVPVGALVGVAGAGLALGAYSMSNASNYYALGGDRNFWTNPEGMFGNAGSLMRQAFSPDTEEFYRSQGGEVYRTAVDMGLTGNYTLSELSRIEGDVSPLGGLVPGRRVNVGRDFGRSVLRAGITEQFVKNLQYGNLEIDEETSASILGVWTQLNPGRSVDYPVPTVGEAQALSDLVVRGNIDPQSFRDLIMQSAATRGISTNDTTGRQQIYDEYLRQLSFNPNVLQRTQELLTSVPVMQDVNAARRQAGLGNLADDWVNQFSGTDQQQARANLEIWGAGRMAAGAFDARLTRQIDAAITSGDYALANRLQQVDASPFASMALYQGLPSNGLIASTEAISSYLADTKSNPMLVNMPDEYRSSMGSFLSRSRQGIVDNYSGADPRSQAMREEFETTYAELYAQGVDPNEIAARRLRQSFRLPTTENIANINTSLLQQFANGQFTQDDINNAITDKITEDTVDTLLASGQRSGLGTTIDQMTKERFITDPAFAAAYAGAQVARDEGFIANQSSGMASLYNMVMSTSYTDPLRAEYELQGINAAGTLYSAYRQRGDSDQAVASMIGTIGTISDPIRRDMALAAQQGDPMAWSRLQPGGAYAMYDPTTGMRSMYGSISRDQYELVQAAFPGWATMPYEEGFSEFGIQSELMQNQRDSFNIGKKYQRIGMNMGYGITTGNLAMAGAAFNELGMTLNMGNGMGMWQVEDAQRALSRAQALFGTQQDTKNMDLAVREFNLQGQQFYEKFGLNQRQFQANTEFSRFQMGMGRTQQLAQREWNWEDFNFQGDQMELEFSWQMEDYNRNIRYARGREKRDLMRQKSRDVTRFAMQQGQRDRVEDRMEQQNTWEDEVFAKEKEHFEQNVRFQQEEMDLSKRHFEQDRQLQWERLNMQQEAHTKNVQWMMQRFALEDQAILLERQQYQASYTAQVQEFTQMTALQQRAMELQNTLSAITGYYERIAAALSVATSGDLLNLLNGAKQTLPGTYSGYTGTAAISGVATAPNTSGLPSNVQSALDALYNNYAGVNNNATRPATGRYASGGYTGRGGKYEKAGDVHKGEWVVPQEGAMVIRGEDPVRAEVDQKMIELMQENNNLLRLIAANPTMYQTIVNGQVQDTMPLSKAVKARL